MSFGPTDAGSKAIASFGLPSLGDGATIRKTTNFEVVGAGKELRIIDNHRDGSSTKQLFDRDTIL
jgi:hypothetical protein